MKEETREFLKKEMKLIREDVLNEYNSSGKRVSGQFEEGLETTIEGNKYILKGYTYLAGRKAGKMPPIQNILEWVKRKGIFEYEKESQASSIAFLIARKIGREGTSTEYEKKVYETVLTPQRIQTILNGVIEIENRIYITDIVQTISQTLKV